ncbi:transposase [Hymenobacter arizonensis]|uniref:transposase n=1 Tax=Hymenobacter arizonensis TaxID=1227077 RepID=UPI000AEE0C7F|nr:transposase [Hymenobacter arizonensis]
MATKTSGSSPDKRRKYDEAFKAEALRLAGESRSTQAAARQLGISPKLLYRWQRAQLVAEVGSEEVARDPEVRALRARLQRAEQELDILGHLRPADPVSTYQHIARQAAHAPVRQLCQVLQVAPSAYYAWQRRRQLPAAEPAWQVAVEVFAYHSQRYGTPRLRVEVQAQGHAVGRWRIRRVLKAHGLRALRVRPNSPARLCPVRPTRTRPCGSTAARAKSWAGTCATPGPKTW